MICKNCLKENDNDSKFCVFCGSKFNTENSSYQPYMCTKTTPQYNGSSAIMPADYVLKQRKQRKRRRIVIIAFVSVVTAIFLFFAGIFIWASNYTPFTTYINDELIFSGYDGNGRIDGGLSVYTVIKFDELEKDLQTQIAKENGGSNLGTAYMLNEVLLESIDVELDKEDKFSNGDVITATITIDYDAINTYAPKTKLIGDKTITKQYTVSGLTPLTEVDPFETVKDVAIMEKDGKKEIVVVDPTSNFYAETMKDNNLNWSFKDIDNPSSYSEGDKVILELNERDADNATTLGYRFSKLSQEYTLCSLSPVTNKKQLNDEAINQVIGLAEETVDRIDYDEADFSNSSVYFHKSIDTNDTNKLIVIYSVSGKYKYFCFYNLYISSNGNITDKCAEMDWKNGYFEYDTVEKAAAAVNEEEHGIEKIR